MEKKKVTLYLTGALAKRLKIGAAMLDSDQSGVAAVAIAEYLNKNGIPKVDKS
jgi:hypothetical protein